MKYEKGSFVVVPNKEVLFGLEPYIQAVYFWICNYSNEQGECFPSRTTLAKCAGCSVKSVDRAFEVLHAKGILSKRVRKDGLKNLTNIYQLMIVDNDLEGYSDCETPPSDCETPGVGTEGRTELYSGGTQSTEVSAVATAPRVIVQEPSFGGEDSGEKRIPKTRAKYADGRKAFKWLPCPEPSWLKNTTELDCGNLLFARGEERVKRMVQFVKDNKDHEDWKFTVLTPCDYERKWIKINEWKKSHGL